MIESLTVVNFQSHRKTTVRFDKRVTTIVGENDRGKSALLRALQWLCTNSPSGDSFIRHGKSFVKAILKVDGRKVVRSKGKKNTYSLDDKQYHAFGQSVPPDIASLLNVSEENFQGQDDPLFWFYLTPGQVSKELNRIVNLDSMDESLSHIATEVRRARTEAELTAKRLQEAKVSLSSLHYVSDANKALTQIELKNKDMTRNRSRIVAFRGLIEKTQRYVDDEKHRKATILDGQKLIQTGERLRTSRKRLSSLRSLVQSTDDAATLARRKVPEVGVMDKLGARLEKVRKRCQSLRSLIEETLRARETLRTTSQESSDAEERLRREMGKECPLCNQPLK